MFRSNFLKIDQHLFGYLVPRGFGRVWGSGFNLRVLKILCKMPENAEDGIGRLHKR